MKQNHKIENIAIVHNQVKFQCIFTLYDDEKHKKNSLQESQFVFQENYNRHSVIDFNPDIWDYKKHFIYNYLKSNGVNKY